MEIEMRLNHLDVPVTDTLSTKAFFEKHFGFKAILVRDDGLVVMLDEAGFAFTLSSVPDNSVSEFPSGFHVGFNLATESELRSAHQRLVDAGVPIVRPLGMLGGALTFHCTAPGAVLVELAWRDNSR